MKKTEICLYCGDEYVPKRRGAQKFCTNSCRSRHWQIKQNVETKEVSSKIENTVESQGAKIEKMSFAGVGNAAAGVAAVEVVKSIFTPENNKPATKKDIEELKRMINGGRYFPIINVPIDGFGRSPYYDFETGNLVYLSV